MTSGWPGLRVARARRSHQMLTDENESPAPSQKKRLTSSLDTLCTRLSRRLPLGVVDANSRAGPSWEPLESSETAQGVARCSRKAWGSVAQKIQKSYQRSSRAHAGSPHPATRRSARLSASPSASSGVPPRTASPSSQGSSLRRLSQWMAKDLHLPLLRRSQREASLRSPYSSQTSLCSTRGECSEEEEEVESVATGIQQLKHLSQVFDEAIATDERKQAIAHYRLLMTHNLRAMRQYERRPWASGRRRTRGLADHGHQ